MRPFLAVFNFLVVWVVKRRIKKFPKITVIFALLGVVGSRGRNTAAALAKSSFAALKVLMEAHTEEAATFDLTPKS